MQMPQITFVMEHITKQYNGASYEPPQRFEILNRSIQRINESDHSNLTLFSFAPCSLAKAGRSRTNVKRAAAPQTYFGAF